MVVVTVLVLAAVALEDTSTSLRVAPFAVGAALLSISQADRILSSSTDLIFGTTQRFRATARETLMVVSAALSTAALAGIAAALIATLCTATRGWAGAATNGSVCISVVAAHMVSILWATISTATFIFSTILQAQATISKQTTRHVVDNAIAVAATCQANITGFAPLGGPTVANQPVILS